MKTIKLYTIFKEPLKRGDDGNLIPAVDFLNEVLNGNIEAEGDYEATVSSEIQDLANNTPF